jgi:Uma2 family endonuclease
MRREVDMTATLIEASPLVVTAEEYEAMPPNSRVELVDGVVRVMTPATVRHQRVVSLLERALESGCPEHLRVLREQEIRLGDLHRRNPDLLVVPADAVDLDGYSFRPEQVVLAVEVVSPGTQITDRTHKPAEYAEGGVAHYWRVETRPDVVVHTYLLGETGQYLETGLFRTDDVTVVPGLPWARIRVAELVPRP